MASSDIEVPFKIPHPDKLTMMMKLGGDQKMDSNKVANKMRAAIHGRFPGVDTSVVKFSSSASADAALPDSSASEFAKKSGKVYAFVPDDYLQNLERQIQQLRRDFDAATDATNAATDAASASAELSNRVSRDSTLLLRQMAEQTTLHVALAAALEPPPSAYFYRSTKLIDMIAASDMFSPERLAAMRVRYPLLQRGVSAMAAAGMPLAHPVTARRADGTEVPPTSEVLAALVEEEYEGDAALPAVRQVLQCLQDFDEGGAGGLFVDAYTRPQPHPQGPVAEKAAAAPATTRARFDTLPLNRQGPWPGGVLTRPTW